MAGLDEIQDSVDLCIEDDFNASSDDYEFLLDHSNSWQVEDGVNVTQVTIVDMESKEVLAKSEIECPELSTDNNRGDIDEKDESKPDLVIDEKGFQCNTCSKKFRSKSSLNRHQLIHMTKQFRCEICEKEFTYKCNLDVHMLNHSGVRAFKCDECGKEFTQKCRLATHQLIHTGIKAFSCDICGKTFISKSTLNRHNMTHSGIKRFKCDECGREFNEKCNLEVHLLTHSGIKPFKCDICKRTFSRKYTLNTHMTIHMRKGEFKKEDILLSSDKDEEDIGDACAEDIGDACAMFSIKEELTESDVEEEREERGGVEEDAEGDEADSLVFDDPLEDTEDQLHINEDVTGIIDHLQQDDDMTIANICDPLGLAADSLPNRRFEDPLHLEEDVAFDEEIDDSAMPSTEFNMHNITPLIST